jgi:hypothetical protein
MREQAPLQHTRIPSGCDQQGRYPQAAECCTELGNEDDDGNSVMPLAIAAVAVVLLIAVGIALA